MNVACNIFKILFISLFLTGYLPSASFAADTQQPAKPAADTDQPPAPPKATLIELYSWATILPKQLIDLQNKLDQDQSYDDVTTELPAIEKEVDSLKKDTTAAQDNPQLQLMEVTAYQARVSKISARLDKLSVPITSAITFLSNIRKDWQNKHDQITDRKRQDEISLALAKEDQRTLLKTVNDAGDLIDKYLKKALDLGKEIGDLQIAIYSVDKSLQTLSSQMRLTSIQKTSPSMLSGAFYARIKPDIFYQSYESTIKFITDRLTTFGKNIGKIIFGGFLLAMLCYGLIHSRQLVSGSSRWQPFASCPLSTAVFIAISMYSFFNLLPSQNTSISQQGEAMKNIFLMLAVMRLTPYIVASHWQRKVLISLTMFLTITIFFIALGLPQLVMHLYVFYVSLVALIYYFSRIRSVKQLTGLESWFKRFWGFFPAIVVVSGISGYDQFAVMAFSTVLAATVTCLIVWMLYLLHLGFLELLLAALPFSLLRDNSKIIFNSLQPVIAWLHIYLLAASEAVIWDLFPTVNEAMSGISKLGVSIGGLHFSPGFIFIIILVFYSAMLTSRAIQALLVRNVLPRYGAEKGVQVSVTRLAHYAILTIGFIIMLRLLGFELSQLTLVGGALGVGIGFGLQAIVNNFASGLILLFERPLKVGDTIQLGEEFGEVKSLGLRSTIIQTFDNAEIVVPNSDLITGQVINWTLADRKVRVKIPIGVAYGSNVSKVIEILEACGRANPMVLSTPAPKAYFLAFGASSLDFDLRVWIPEFLDKLQVLSELNQDIESEFSLNNIEIPFPQQDLHLRSIAPGLTRQFSKSGQATEEEVK